MILTHLITLLYPAKVSLLAHQSISSSGELFWAGSFLEGLKPYHYADTLFAINGRGACTDQFML